MPNRVYLSEALLQPVGPEQLGGRDLRFEPIFSEIIEARRSDDVTGKLPQWDVVAELSLEALKTSKDIRLCCFLTEAGIFLDGFPGLRDCLRLAREIVTRFWDQGLLPLIEDGDLDYRSGSLAWFNDRMADAVRLIPITSRSGGGENYSFSRFLQAQRIGSEDSIQKMAPDKRETVSSLRSQGWITLDAFESAMKSTRRKHFEAIFQTFNEARQQFLDLEKVIDEKCGQASPSFKEARETFSDMLLLLQSTLKKKVEEEPDAVAGAGPAAADDGPQAATSMAGFWTAGMPAESGSWQQAEALVRAGSVDQGLQKMAALAALETSVRGRFLRKLMLVDVCRNAGRDRLAKTILEELNEQIKDYRLDQWESTALVGAVWSRLYRLYKKGESNNEQEQAVILYNQICRLDPWQAYIDCED
jgi:type VI secretion system protein ImpA